MRNNRRDREVDREVLPLFCCAEAHPFLAGTGTLPSTFGFFKSDLVVSFSHPYLGGIDYTCPGHPHLLRYQGVSVRACQAI